MAPKVVATGMHRKAARRPIRRNLPTLDEL
jgi:hypothetical protein